MIDVTLTRKQVDVLLPALKTAESAYTTKGDFQASKLITALHVELQKQLFTFEKVEEN